MFSNIDLIHVFLWIISFPRTWHVYQSVILGQPKVQARLRPESHKRLKALARTTDRDVSYLMAEAAERYVEAWRVEANSALREPKATGGHQA
jgi:hypothetical protein